MPDETKDIRRSQPCATTPVDPLTTPDGAEGDLSCSLVAWLLAEYWAAITRRAGVQS